MLTHGLLIMKNLNEPDFLKVLSPYNQNLIAKVSLCNLEQAEAMIEKASLLFKDRGKKLEHSERIAILRRLAQMVSDDEEEFAKLISREGGKPLVDARVEVTRAIEGILYAANEVAIVFQGDGVSMGLTSSSHDRRAYTFNEPIGVVVAVSAFNHPLNLIVHQVIPAIAVGCPVIVKPSELTPLNCIRLVELLYKAGLPRDWCQVCICDRIVAESLVKSPKIHFFSFIGSAKVGWYLRSQLAPGVRYALEHGGLAPVFVEPDADLSKTIPALLKGGFYHAGQVCVSVQRVFTHVSVLEDFLQQIKSGAEKLIVGPATDEKTEIGPLIEPKVVDRIESWVQEALGMGAELISGGRRLGESTYSPTILLNPHKNSKVSNLEVFGPVICVHTYSNLEEAICLANGLDYSFQASVFTESIRAANQCIEGLDASAVIVNDHPAFRVDWMPFAGRKKSGSGVGGIGYTMRDLVQHKMVVWNL